MNYVVKNVELEVYVGSFYEIFTEAYDLLTKCKANTVTYNFNNIKLIINKDSNVNHLWEYYKGKLK
jgi:lipocalin